MEVKMKNVLQIVDFETAKQLKELGYNYPVRNVYFENTGEEIFRVEIGLYNVLHDIISAPYLEEVKTWLRDEYNLHVICEKQATGWMGSLMALPDWGMDKVNQKDTYENALSSIIKKAVDYLQSKEYLKDTDFLNQTQ